MGMVDEDYLAHPDEEDIGAWWRRQFAGAASGAANPLGLTGRALKKAAEYAPDYISPEKADLFDRQTRENMREARTAAGMGAGVPLGFLGGFGGTAALGARMGLGLFPMSFLTRNAATAIPPSIAAGGQFGSIVDDYFRDEGDDLRMRQAQGRYRTGGY